MANAIVDTNFGLEMRYALRAFSQASGRVTAAADLTAAEFRLLRALGEGEASTQSELATVAAMDRPYVSSLIKKMIERGLLETEVNEEDRRRIDIVFTREGAKLHRRIARQLEAVNRRALAGIEPGKLRAFADVLNRIRDNLEE